MKPFDFLKAAAFAALILFIDVLVAVAVVYVWGTRLDPGHPQAYYEAAAVPIARLSTRVVGTALMFAAAWACARRHPRRNAHAFALTMVFCYGLLDAASVQFREFVTLSMGLTLSLKAGAALLGAHCAVRARAAVPARTAPAP